MKTLDFLDKLLFQLTVQLIMTPKDEFVTCKEDETIANLKERLKKFDFIPVYADKIKYYVSKIDVENTLKKNSSEKVKEIKQFISEKKPISEESSIHDYLLNRNEPVFVTKDNEVVGMVTPADLNKISSKMVFYIILSNLEQILINLIKKQHFEENKIEGYLGFTKLWNAKGIFELNKRENMVLSVFECMNISDLICITYKSKEIRKILNYSTENEAKKDLCPLVDLRNKIMHTGYSFIQNEKQLNKRRLQYLLIKQLITELLEQT